MSSKKYLKLNAWISWSNSRPRSLICDRRYLHFCEAESFRLTQPGGVKAMAIERLVVTNHERWGNLVKTWSTGKNYLGDDNEYPIPESVDEFKEQLAKAQVFMTVAERFTQIKFVAQEMDTIVVRLPPKFAIEDSEERLSQPGATYPIPPFYKRLFNGIDPVIPEDEKFRVHAERIGDYTISYCARSDVIGRCSSYPRRGALRHANPP